MGEPTNAAWVNTALQNGLLRPDQLPAGAGRGRAKPVPLVAPAFEGGPAAGRASWTVPVRTESEANRRDHWRSVGRVKAQRDAVTRAMAPHWRAFGPLGDEIRAGRPLRVRLVRVGGGRLDKANLPRALKAVEDAVALVLGADDGSPLWLVEWDQEPGPAYGVRIELSLVED